MTDTHSITDDVDDRDDLPPTAGADDGGVADTGYDDGVEDEPEYDAFNDVAGDELRDLVQFVASSLVDRPEDVEVLVAQRGQSVQLTLVVPEDELGKVIGRQGRIARAIRTVTMIAGSRHNVRASLDIEG